MYVELQPCYRQISVDFDQIATNGLGFTNESPHDEFESEPELQWRLGYLDYVLDKNPKIMDELFLIRSIVDDAKRLHLRETPYFESASTPNGLRRLLKKYQPMKTGISERLTTKGNIREVLRRDLVNIMNPVAQNTFREFVELNFPGEIDEIGRDETPEIT